MSTPPKGPSRFIPTLTEVVGEPQSQAALAVLKHRLDVPQGAAGLRSAAPPASLSAPSARVMPPPQSQGAAPVATPPVRLLPPGFEEYVVHRVMQRVDAGLEQHLRDAIAAVVQEQTRSLLPRLREEVESVVRHVVYEAVADELAVGELTDSIKR